MFVKYDGDKPNEVFENIAKLRRQSGGHSRPIRYGKWQNLQKGFKDQHLTLKPFKK